MVKLSKAAVSASRIAFDALGALDAPGDGLLDGGVPLDQLAVGVELRCLGLDRLGLLAELVGLRTGGVLLGAPVTLAVFVLLALLTS